MSDPVSEHLFWPQGAAAQRIGRHVAGCRVERLLGAGAMGEAYLARRLSCGSSVVVKFPSLEVASNPRARARFQREGEALLKIRPHPNVVRVLDIGGDEDPALILEFVDGLSLLGVLQREGRLAPREAARVARDVALGMVAVHRHGLLHRDLKPDNLLLTARREVKIVDFGVAKDVFRTALTGTAQFVGTAPYSAPERWNDEAEDERCDVFSLGATLYELVTGRHAFPGGEPHELFERIAGGRYTPPRELVPELPVGLEQVIVQMLVAERELRYGRMRDVADDLDRVLAGLLPSVAGLRDAAGRVYPLVPARRHVIGSGPACSIRLVGPDVDEQHAQLRREGVDLVLRDLRSRAGTFVGPRRVERPRAVCDGDELRCGQVALRVLDPRRRPAPPSYLDDVPRARWPAPLLDVLVEFRDRRSLLHLLERLSDDPWGSHPADRALSGLLGEETARAVHRVRAARAQRERAGLLAALQVVSGIRPANPHLAEGWLAWWAEVHGDHGLQVGASAHESTLTLSVVGGPSRRLAEADSVLLVGRDPKCHLVLVDPAVSRLHVKVLRLHERWLIRGEARSSTLLNERPLSVTFLRAGDQLELGASTITVGVGHGDLPQPGAWRPWPVDLQSCEALEELGHPAVATALVGALHELRDQSWVDRASHALFGGEPHLREELQRRLRERLERRARRARERLPALLGADPGADLAKWGQLLAEQRARLPPQVQPAGWLANSR